MWAITQPRSQPATVFHYAISRNQDVPLMLLNCNNTAIVVDGYHGYQKACATYCMTKLGGVAYARRKFKSAR
ncbi:IS66 family transposase [Sessilibacter corallicola]|uniref:IS66 family transposase n=1 Tax=Sessilibacter corallicola TaxID=2904075 RepID=UPI001E558AFD|nr:IS66 family transposase [Sessilibacter corallicola]MCE2030162.1 IS66 family transposase [Sessilibacter corallicola]